MHLTKSALLVATGAILTICAFSIPWEQLGQSSGNSNGNNIRLLPKQQSNLLSRVKKLENSLQDSLKAQTQLLELVNELSNKIEPTLSTLENNSFATSKTDLTGSNLKLKNPLDRQKRWQLKRLTDAGISADRAEFIMQKQERLQYEQMKLSYAYHSLEDKASAEAAELQEKISTHNSPHKVFSEELNSKEFEQYLQSVSGHSELEINSVLHTTPAADAGLQPGDKIISYNNKRVFHRGDLIQQVYQVKPKKTVAVEIQKKGSSSREIIYVPSGPLGIGG